MEKKALMTTYNMARAAARAGKLDAVRTNKALGILQSKDGGAGKFAQYHTSIKHCSCPDYYRTGQPCKHMIAMMITVRANQQKAPMQPQAVKYSQKVYIAANDDVLMAEQGNGKYTVHTFNCVEQFRDFEKAHQELNFVHPANATGKRQKPDIDHSQEF